MRLNLIYKGLRSSPREAGKKVDCICGSYVVRGTVENGERGGAGCSFQGLPIDGIDSRERGVQQL